MSEPRIIPHPHQFKDERGVFTRTYEALEGFNVAEENESHSVALRTIRGLHWQEPEQTKLVRVLAGAILDVVVERATGLAKVYPMGPETGSLLVPKGWAHGFVTITANTTVLYKVDVPFAPNAQYAINWFDPQFDLIRLGVTPDTATMSDKDRLAPTLAEVQARAA